MADESGCSGLSYQVDATIVKAFEDPSDVFMSFELLSLRGWWQSVGGEIVGSYVPSIWGDSLSVGKEGVGNG